MEHLEYRLLIDYASHGLGTAEELRVEEHIATCSECLHGIRALRYLRHNFESIWPVWAPAELARLHRQWKVLAGLAKVGGSSPGLAGSAKQWMDQLNQGCTRALNALLNRARGLAGIGLGGLPEGYSFQLQPVVLGVGAPDRKARRHLQRCSEFLAKEQTDKAERELRQASKTDARFCQSARSQVLSHNRPQAQVTIDSRRGRVGIRFWPSPGEPSPPFALLLPGGDPERAVAGAFEPVEGEEYLVAEFNNVPDGFLELYW